MECAVNINIKIQREDIRNIIKVNYSFLNGA